MAERLLLKNGRAMLSGEKTPRKLDLLLEDGILVKAEPEITDPADRVLDLTGLTVMPALTDIHVHFRDPGFLYKEDLVTGTAAAAAGGFTRVACMPNTKPSIDTPETVTYILDKVKNEGSCTVYPIGAISMGLRGEVRTDFAALKAAGATAVSDDGRPVENPEMMRVALIEAKKAGLKVCSHCEVLPIIAGGIMHKGWVSEKLGVKGMDRLSEDIATEREIALCKATDCPLHICHVSTAGAIEEIRRAKAEGVPVTAETAPHYFLYTHEKLLGRDANFRMNPPLREESDRRAVLEALLDGTIDIISTDHAPHSAEEKADFEHAPNGVVGLETSFPACYTNLVKTGLMSLHELHRRMCELPCEIMGVEPPLLTVGQKAELCAAALDETYTVNPDEFASKGRNTLFAGVEFCGKNHLTVMGDRITYHSDRVK